MVNETKVLVFSFAYDPIEGGAEIMLRKVTDNIKDISFHIITFKFDNSHPKKEANNNVTIYRIKSFTRFMFPFIAYVFSLKLRRKEKFTHIWSIMANYAGFAAMMHKKTYKKTPFILTLQEGDPIPYIKKKVRFIYPFFKEIFNSADIVHAISSYLANFAKEMGFKGDVRIIPNGVDSSFILDKVSWPRHNNEKIILITTSRLVKKNGVDDIIKALTFLPDNVILHIIGDGQEKDYLINLSRELNLENRVIFFGHIQYEELPKYLKTGDIYVRPSRSEGLGSSFLEAMAAGLPVIGTCTGGISDFLIDKKTGFLCEVNNPKSIADIVNFIINPENEHLVRSVITESNKLIKDKYTWDKVSEGIRSLFY